MCFVFFIGKLLQGGVEQKNVVVFGVVVLESGCLMEFNCVLGVVDAIFVSF